MSANDTQVGGDHYRQPVQPWEAMHAWLMPTQFEGFLLGNAVKYLARYNAMTPGKGGLQDVRKAVHYLEKLIEVREAADKTPPQPIRFATASEVAADQGRALDAVKRAGGRYA